MAECLRVYGAVEIKTAVDSTYIYADFTFYTLGHLQSGHDIKMHPLSALAQGCSSVPKWGEHAFNSNKSKMRTCAGVVALIDM